MDGLEPRVSQFGSALNWLLRRDVSSARLASLFTTTAENIRVIAFRVRAQQNSGAAIDAARIHQKPDSETARQVGIRPGLDDAEWTPARTRRLDLLRNEVDEAVAHFSSRYDFLGGAQYLRRRLQYIGYAGDARRIALAAFLHQQTAWFLVHCGRCVSATKEADIARHLWRVAWHESGDDQYAAGFVSSALIGSHSRLLSHRPEEALKALDLARDAAESIGAPLGSDHFRQRGVALLQLRQDAQSAKYFEKSAELMEKLNEATLPAQILMTGQRHIGILGALNCDQANGVLAAARSAFGEGSLENSIALHWAAASCLCSDSPSLIRYAVAELSGQAASLVQFGHQLTIRRLLSITPELGLDDRLRRAWVRRALYENAVQSR